MSDTPELVRAEDLREGDLVQIVIEGLWTPKRAGDHTHAVVTASGTASTDEEYVNIDWFGKQPEIRRLPPKGRPLEVGEEVDFEPGVHANGRGVVVAINGHMAWIDWFEANHEVVRIDSLYRPDGTPITEN